MGRSSELTLSEIARLLGEKEHRLIYLCEKGVIVPDVEDARGRGSSRLFSKRNVLDFAVALRLREAMVPASAAAAVIQVLRAFERAVAREISGFALPESLTISRAPDLRVVLVGGRHLFFTLGPKGEKPKVFGGIDIRSLKGSKRVTLAEVREGDRQSMGAKVRIEINVTRIAQELPLGG